MSWSPAVKFPGGVHSWAVVTETHAAVPELTSVMLTWVQIDPDLDLGDGVVAWAQQELVALAPVQTHKGYRQCWLQGYGDY